MSPETLNQNPNSGLLTVYQPAGFSGTIGTVTATTSGTTVVLKGDPTSTTNNHQLPSTHPVKPWSSTAAHWNLTKAAPTKPAS